jgi:hypothetical protein
MKQFVKLLIIAVFFFSILESTFCFCNGCCETAISNPSFFQINKNDVQNTCHQEITDAEEKILFKKNCNCYKIKGFYPLFVNSFNSFDLTKPFWEKNIDNYRSGPNTNFIIINHQKAYKSDLAYPQKFTKIPQFLLHQKLII